MCVLRGSKDDSIEMIICQLFCSIPFSVCGEPIDVIEFKSSFSGSITAQHAGQWRGVDWQIGL